VSARRHHAGAGRSPSCLEEVRFSRGAVPQSSAGWPRSVSGAGAPTLASRRRQLGCRIASRGGTAGAHMRTRPDPVASGASSDGGTRPGAAPPTAGRPPRGFVPTRRRLTGRGGLVGFATWKSFDFSRCSGISSTSRKGLAAAAAMLGRWGWRRASRRVRESGLRAVARVAPDALRRGVAGGCGCSVGIAHSALDAAPTRLRGGVRAWDGRRLEVRHALCTGSPVTATPQRGRA
jgi:hypothetical protein